MCQKVFQKVRVCLYLLTVVSIDMTVSFGNLRAMLCNRKQRGNFQILDAIRYFREMSKNALCEGCYFTVGIVTPDVCR